MYSNDLERALRTAIAAHNGQTRKSADSVPYVVHPFHVCVVLARWGMRDEVLQAGVLHDVVEDCEDWTTERVRDEFGEEVAGIVAELTEDKTQSWRRRKQAAVDHVETMSIEAAAVKAADKLHNLQSLIHELGAAEQPDYVWSLFRGGRDDTLDMAERLVEALERRLEPRYTQALREALDELRRLG